MDQGKGFLEVRLRMNSHVTWFEPWVYETIFMMGCSIESISRQGKQIDGAGYDVFVA